MNTSDETVTIVHVGNHVRFDSLCSFALKILDNTTVCPLSTGLAVSEALKVTDHLAYKRINNIALWNAIFEMESPDSCKLLTEKITNAVHKAAEFGGKVAVAMIKYAGILYSETVKALDEYNGIDS